MRPCQSSRPIPRTLSAVLSLLLSSTAQAQATRLLLVDIDAEAGALLELDLTAPSGAAPKVLASADLGAPWIYPVGVAFDPAAGQSYVSDLGDGIGAVGDGAIYRFGAGPVELVAADPVLREPTALTLLPDGTLVVADFEADPSGLGPDDVGGAGHGALLRVDPATGDVSVLADGLLHAVPGINPADSAFQDPMGVVYDPVATTLYVADYSAVITGGLVDGALFAVDPASGAVTLVSDDDFMVAPVAVAVLSDGTPLVADSLLYDSYLFSINLTEPDLLANAVEVTQSAGGAGFRLNHVAVGSGDEVFVVDSGDYDEVLESFIYAPGIYRVDLALPSTSNADVVHDSPELLTPSQIAVPPGSAPCPVEGFAALRALRGVKDGEGATFSWQADQAVVSEYHLNSVRDKGMLNDAEAHRPPAPGGATPECDAPGTGPPQCTDDDAIAAAPLLFYQVFSACGTGGEAEGPFAD